MASPMTSPVMPADVPASSADENQQQNPVAVLNQYSPGLTYRLVGECGQPHLKSFTMEVTIDGQVGLIIRCFVKMSLLYCTCNFGFLKILQLISCAEYCIIEYLAQDIRFTEL